MAAFVDDNNQPISTVTNENLEKFQQYLQNITDLRDLPSLQIDKSVDLNSILSDKNNNKIYLSANQSTYLARMLNRSKYNPAWVEELIDNAEKYPTLLADTYLISGNSSSSPLYDAINKQLSNRNFADNIPAIHALIMNGNVLYNEDLGKGEVTKLSSKNQQYINDIFEKSSYADISNRYKVDTELLHGVDNFIKSTAVSRFLNYEQASPKFRSFIMQQVLTANTRVSTEEMLNKMNPKLYTREAVGEILNYGIVTPDMMMKDTSKAKTQKEKNINILPAYYRNIMNAIVKIAEKENQYDSKNYGQIKSLTQRYLDMCKEIAPNAQNNGIFKMGLMKVAHQDIINGDAAKLDTEILQTIIDNDKDGFYLRKIPEDVLDAKHVQLTRDMRFVSRLKNANKILENIAVSDAVTYNDLSSQEKNNLIKAAKEKIAEQKNIDKYLQERLDAYALDKKEIEKQSKEVSKNTFIEDSINKLQSKFQAIQKHLKNGKPNDQEQFLTHDAVEKHISAYLKGNKQPLNFPEQKSLPLLIGRKEEQQRRNDLDKAIQDFNKTLESVVINSQRTYQTEFPDFTMYDGIILTDEAKNKAAANKQTANDKLNLKVKQFDTEYRDIDNTRRQKSVIDRQKESLEKAQQHLVNYHNRLSKMATDRLGFESDKKLQAVTAEMTPEQKREVRKQNKQITSKLEDKAQNNAGLSDTQKVQKTIEEIRAYRR